MKKYACLSQYLPLLVLAFVPMISSAQETRPLELGKSIEETLATGQTRAYQLALAAGQFAHLTVKQKGENVSLVVFAPNGEKLTVVDALVYPQGTEHIFLVAESAGSYRLEITAEKGGAAAGGYAVTIDELRLAKSPDQARFTAQRRITQARLTDKKDETLYLNQALSLWRELGDRYGEAYTLQLIGTVCLSSNKYDQAIEFFHQALVIGREIKDRVGEGSALANLGLAYRSGGSAEKPFEKSIEYYEQALVISREITDPIGEVNILNGIAIACGPLARFDKGIEAYQQALAISREIKDQIGEGIALNGLGNANYSTARYEKAIEYYEQALAVRRAAKDRAGEASTLSNLGNVYNLVSRYEKAIEYLEQALVLSRAAKNRRLEGIILSNLGNNYLSLSRSEKAAECYEQSLAIFDEIRNPGLAAYSLTNLGNIYLSQRRYEKAIDYIGRALAINRKEGNRVIEGDTLNYLGNAYVSLQHYEKAIECFDQALAISREVKSPAQEVTALRSLAEVEGKRGALARARTYIEQSLRVSEALRADLISSTSRASFHASAQKSYQLYIDILMAQHRNEPMKGLDEAALEVSERRRARSLLDLLAEAQADVRQGVDAAMLERERGLGRQLNDKAQRLAQAKTPEQVAALQQEISQLEIDYERAQVAIRQSSPHFAALTQPQPLKATQIQQLLDAETLLLEYVLGEEQSWLWVVAPDSITSYRLPPQADIERATKPFHQLLSAAQPTPTTEARLRQYAQTLSMLLLSPAAAQLGQKRLVIVADGILQYLPFAALPEPAGAIERKSEGGKERKGATPPFSPSLHRSVTPSPLIVNHEIVSLPSASTLAVLRNEQMGRKTAPKTVAVLADPVFSANDPRVTTSRAASLAVVAPMQSEQTTGADSSPLNRTLRDFRGPLARLYFSREEAEAIYATVPRGAGYKALDFQANRNAVTNSDLSQYRIVHFATHGVLNSSYPELSGLIFSLVDEKGTPQDGFLRLHDVYNLRLNADLVVLSACQSGLGKEIKGEGLIGLTRGFMYAGSPRVVASLWKVDDVATAELMKRFYRGMLQQGQRPAAALRTAQLEMLRKMRWEHPFYWAAFTLQGEWK